MRKFFFFIFTLAICISCKSQKNQIERNNEEESNSLIFDQMEAQGVDTKGELLYGYFFFDKNKKNLNF